MFAREHKNKRWRGREGEEKTIFFPDNIMCLVSLSVLIRSAAQTSCRVVQSPRDGSRLVLKARMNINNELFFFILIFIFLKIYFSFLVAQKLALPPYPFRRNSSALYTECFLMMSIRQEGYSAAAAAVGVKEKKSVCDCDPRRKSRTNTAICKLYKQ